MVYFELSELNLFGKASRPKTFEDSGGPGQGQAQAAAQAQPRPQNHSRVRDDAPIMPWQYLRRLDARVSCAGRIAKRRQRSAQAMAGLLRQAGVYL